jgi:hypothetical protein
MNLYQDLTKIKPRLLKHPLNSEFYVLTTFFGVAESEYEMPKLPFFFFVPLLRVRLCVRQIHILNQQRPFFGHQCLVLNNPRKLLLTNS